MAIKKLKPKTNSQAGSPALPEPSAIDVGEMFTNKFLGNGYLKKEDGNFQDLGPVKSVNGKDGAVSITSGDIPSDGKSVTEWYYLTPASTKNSSVIVLDYPTNIGTIEIVDEDQNPFPVFTQFLICQLNAVKFQIICNTGKTILSKDNKFETAGNGTMCALVKVNETTWMLGGALQ